MVAFSSFLYLGATGVVSRSQMCLWNSRACVPTGKRNTHDWLSYGPEWNTCVHKREMRDVVKKAWLILGRGPGGRFGAGNVNTGPEGFKTVAPDLADKKYPEVCSQTIDSKITRRVEEPRLLKKQMCRESRRTGRRLCWGNSWERGKV